MPNRASQFMPFDALSGLKDALREVEKICEDKIELSEDIFAVLNRTIKDLKKGDRVKIKYYYNIEYVSIISNVLKVDIDKRYIYLTSVKISFDDIISIDIISSNWYNGYRVILWIFIKKKKQTMSLVKTV